MKILFTDDGIRTEYGSNRIYMHNLRMWLKEIGYDVYYNCNDYETYDVIIFDKNFNFKKAKSIIAKSNAFCGLANNASKKAEGFDFYIAACPTEALYVKQFNPHIVIFPQIENFLGFKNHIDKKNISICYHGNLQHLEQLNSFTVKALEQLSLKVPITLKAIYNIKQLGLWKKRRPNIEIDDVQWNIDTIADEILSCDIGIVPNTYFASEFEKKIFFGFQTLFCRNKMGNMNDYLIRFKCCVNAGRAFVFHQLGLPVVSDLYPEAYHILQNRTCGHIAGNYESWLHGLSSLCESAQYRQKVANNAKLAFDRLYNPIEHAKNMMEDVVELKNLWSLEKRYP